MRTCLRLAALVAGALLLAGGAAAQTPAAAGPTDAAAQASLGMRYERGVGVPQNYALALAWYRKAAEQGDAIAQYRLGAFFEEGRAVQKDMPAAVLWYRKAAGQGNEDAAVSLGHILQLGAPGVPADAAEAMQWFRKAAEQNSAAAQHAIGEAYFFGRGVDKDDAEAARWFQLSVAQGYIPAEASLGYLLLHGEGLAPDPVEGARLLTDAALHGSVSAQYALGRMAETGDGQPKNLNEAYVWYDVAAASGLAPAVQRRDAVARLLSPQDLANAQARAAAIAPDSGATPAAPAVAAGSGSGIVVGHAGEILTARHVADGCREMRIAGGPVASQVVLDPDADLALLRFAPPATPTTPVAWRDMQALRQGEAIEVIGFPYGGALAPGTTVTGGILASLTGPAGDRTLIQISAAAQPGNSGGPVLDAAGNLIGVVTNAFDVSKIAALTGRAPQNINFAVSAEVARSFLEAQGVQVETHPLDRARDPADVAALAQRFTVKLECWK